MHPNDPPHQRPQSAARRPAAVAEGDAGAAPRRHGDYRKRFAGLIDQTNFNRLSPVEQQWIRQQAMIHRFTQQELCLVSDMSLDRQQWKEAGLAASWPPLPVGGDAVQRKKKLLALLRQSHAELRARVRDYADWHRSDKPKAVKPTIKVETKTKLGLGRCPVASEKTRCCNLLTLDAVEQCGFDCSYCSIQSFYHGNAVVFDRDFAARLKRLELDPNQQYHIGTGQSSDSLMWGNHRGVLEALCEFAAAHPNVILEFKTKSKNIAWLLKNDFPENILCTWSLNPQVIITHEEHQSASLEQRLECAEKIAAKNRLVGFHFHPMIEYTDWRSGYADMCRQLVRRFRPEQVAVVSMGALTYAKSVLKTIRRRPFASKILQMPLVETASKYSYPTATKLKLFRQVYSGLADWHERVLFYLCMEPAELWQPVFGYGYATNLELETAMKAAYFSKISALSDRRCAPVAGGAEQPNRAFADNQRI